MSQLPNITFTASYKNKCLVCAVSDSRPGSTLCEPCAASELRKHQQRAPVVYNCVSCNKPYPMRGSDKCSTCALKEIRETRKCSSCSAPHPIPGTSRCANCIVHAPRRPPSIKVAHREAKKPRTIAARGPTPPPMEDLYEAALEVKKSEAPESMGWPYPEYMSDDDLRVELFKEGAFEEKKTFDLTGALSKEDDGTFKAVALVGTTKEERKRARDAGAEQLEVKLRLTVERRDVLGNVQVFWSTEVPLPPHIQHPTNDETFDDLLLTRTVTSVPRKSNASKVTVIHID
jgi:hypothetical protein